MNFSPIILFTYNRLELTQKTVKALIKNELASESELYIFSDGPKGLNDEEKVLELRTFLRSITGFKRIMIEESASNQGLANSVISGV